MKQALLLFLLLIYTISFSFSQINSNGVPLITNYSPKTYEAEEQNWAIVQDKRGVLYFGNNNKLILEYDGVNWRKIPNSNESVIRSLAIDTSGIIYVGAVNDFGYLDINNRGAYSYKSLCTNIDSSLNDFSDIWNININKNGIYFGCEKYIFQYLNNKLMQYPIPIGAVQSFNIENEIYIANFNDGLLVFSDGKTSLAKGGDFFIGKGIYTMNKYDNKILIGTYPQGLYVYNPISGEITDSFKNTKANKFLKDYQLYPSCNYDTTIFVFGTLANGVINMNKQGDILNHYTYTNGLQDATIINLLSDKNKNLWLALNNGISKIEQANAFRYFSTIHGLTGSIVDICSFNSNLIVATSLGLFYKSNSSDVFTPVKNIEGIIWSILPFDDQLLIGTEMGLYVADKNLTVKYVDEDIRSSNRKLKTNYIQKVYRSKKNPNTVFIAGFDGVFSIKNKNNEWQFNTEFPVNGFDIRHILEDSNGNIWFASYMNGILKIIPNDNSRFIHYTSEKGLPSNNELYINSINGTVVIGTKMGFWKYIEEKDFFVKDSTISISGSEIQYFSEDSDKNIWVSFTENNSNKIIRFVYDSITNFYINEALPFKRLPNEKVSSIFHSKNGITWIGSSSGLYSYDKKIKQDTSIDFHTLIRKVSTKNDSILFFGTYFENNDAGLRIPSLIQPDELVITIDYPYNDLSFEFAAPYFVEEQKTQYSYQLVGYNKNWSKWSLETKAIFTNLNEGDYIFKVKAKNIYGIESTTAEYSFSIAPPLYRTILAYIIYGILIIFGIATIVKLYTQKLEQEKIQLENIVQERTAEIRNQNEILHKQKEEILLQKEEITSSIVYAKRIQKAIVPNEDYARTLLKDFFLLWKPRDIVSGDFWWLGEKNGYVVATAADCTGHGVPGAFMSMLGVSFLNEIVKQQDIIQSNEILNILRNKVKSTLGQTNVDSTSKDGMDIGLLVIDFKNMKAQFSGAYNPLYLFRNRELLEFKADRNPIGIYIKEKPFTLHHIDLQKGDTLYMFSDGFPDQFGGDGEKKYSSKRFKEYLASIQDQEMIDQREMLDNEIIDWMKNTHQIDDIIILGIRI